MLQMGNYKVFGMKVFIGHSFNNEDKIIVNKLRELIVDTFKFEWLTGETAENIGVSEKVKKRISECDLFIGVFTKGKPLYNGLLKKPNAYTTSAWVIQESGFAIANCKQIIFLFEEGLDSSLGLQGDLEYIPFNRNNLDPILTKLTQMLMKYKDNSALGDAAPDSAEKAENSSEDISGSSKAGTDEKTSAYAQMFAAKSLDELKEGYEKANSIEDTDENKLWVQAMYLKAAQRFGYQNSISELTKLSEMNPDSGDVLSALANCYSSISEYTKASNLYLKCNEMSTDEYSKIHYFIMANINLSLNNLYLDAINNLIEYLNTETITEDKNRAYLLSEMALLALDNKDYDRFFIFGEYALYLKPDDSNMRFKIAYQYSHNGKHNLSFLHYQKYVNLSNDEVGYNNLAIQYDNLGLKIKTIDNYEKAIELNNTLAMSNLAHRYINNGFRKQAQELINKANLLASEGIEVNGNIGAAQNTLNSKIEDENAKEKEIILSAQKVKGFMVNYSKSYCTKWELDLSKLSGKWETHFGLQNLEFESNNFSFQFKTDIKNDKEYTQVELSGEILNTTINYKIIIKNVNISNPYTILGGGMSVKYEDQGCAIINEDYTNMQILERKTDDKYQFYNWKKA